MKKVNNSNEKNLKILFSPCHYAYSDKIGSEFTWAYNIADRISTLYPKSVVITGYTDKENDGKSYKIIQVQKNKNRVDISYKNAIIFTLKYFLATHRELKKEYNILHHVLPFKLFRTFNITILLSRKKIPFVIGPIQTPLKVNNSGFDNSDLLSFKKNRYKNLSVFKTVYILFSKFIYIFSMMTLRRADKIIVINKITRDSLLGLNISKDKIKVINPGINSTKFPYFRFENKNDKKLKLICTSLLIERKKINLIIRAMRQIIDRKKNISLTIVGDGPQKNELIRLVNELQLSKNVFFVGYVPNVNLPKIYENHHIFVSMSSDESWGQMYLEAMSCGLPVVSSKNNGSSEIIKNDKNGVLIEADDYLMLAEKILILHDDKELLAAMSMRARKDIEEKYDWKNVIIPKYFTLYNNLL